MPKFHLQAWTACFLFFLFTVFQANLVFGETEINLDDESAAPAATPVVKMAAPAQQNKTVAAPTAVPTVAQATGTEITMEENTEPTPTPEPSQEEAATEASPEETSQTETAPAEAAPTPVVVHGKWKVKYIYEAGIKAYKQKDYYKAITYLKKTVAMPRDEYTPKYLIAEAYAMLGIIYQYHIIHYGRAYRYYKAALSVDPQTNTARRHVRQLYKYRHRKD